MTKNASTVVAPAATIKAYNAARDADSAGYGAFVGFIADTAAKAFDQPVTVATFAAYVRQDLSMGKDVTDALKAERNRIKSRITYGLKAAGLLLQKKRQPKPEAKPAKGKGEAAADAAENAKDIAKTNAPDRFKAVCAIMDAMDIDELDRVQNALTARRAAMIADAKEKAGQLVEAVKAKAKPAATKPAARKRAVKKAA